MFNFQHSQITQDDFDKLAKQLLKYSTVYATSKFDVGKINSSLHLPLKPDAVFKKQRASKVPIHLPIIEVAYRVNSILQLLDICQSTILDEELSINIIKSIEKKYRFFHKNTIF